VPQAHGTEEASQSQTAVDKDATVWQYHDVVEAKQHGLPDHPGAVPGHVWRFSAQNTRIWTAMSQPAQSPASEQIGG